MRRRPEGELIRTVISHGGSIMITLPPCSFAPRDIVDIKYETDEKAGVLYMAVSKHKGEVRHAKKDDKRY